jgi:hypothetical protein
MSSVKLFETYHTEQSKQCYSRTQSHYEIDFVELIAHIEESFKVKVNYNVVFVSAYLNKGHLQ